MQRTRRFLLCAAMPIAVLSFACEREARPAPPECTARLAPGSDDQTAVQTALIEAQPGEVLCFDDGVYRFTDELSLSVPNVTLRGTWGGAILDFSDQVTGANALLVTADGFELADLTIRNMAGDGVRMKDIHDVHIHGVRIHWEDGSVATNGAYGLYPVGVTDILVEDCELSGAADAAVYVGQTDRIVVRNNDVHGNVIGIQLENTRDGDVYGNHAHGNTAGILLGVLPNLPVKDGRRMRVHDNLIEENNHPNFGDSTAIIGHVPAGIGVVVMAADQTEIHDNVIRGNSSAGVFLLARSSVDIDFDDPAYDPYPEGAWIHDNTFEQNGYEGQGELAAVAVLVNGTSGAGLTLADVVWDGVVDAAKDDSDGSLDLCLRDNGAATFLDFDFDGNFSSPSRDASPHDCAHPSLPPVTLQP